MDLIPPLPPLPTEIFHHFAFAASKKHNPKAVEYPYYAAWDSIFVACLLCSNPQGSIAYYPEPKLENELKDQRKKRKEHAVHYKLPDFACYTLAIKQPYTPIPASLQNSTLDSMMDLEQSSEQQTVDRILICEIKSCPTTKRFRKPNGEDYQLLVDRRILKAQMQANRRIALHFAEIAASNPQAKYLTMIAACGPFWCDGIFTKPENNWRSPETQRMHTTSQIRAGMDTESAVKIGITADTTNCSPEQVNMPRTMTSPLSTHPRFEILGSYTQNRRLGANDFPPSSSDDDDDNNSNDESDVLDATNTASSNDSDDNHSERVKTPSESSGEDQSSNSDGYNLGLSNSDRSDALESSPVHYRKRAAHVVVDVPTTPPPMKKADQHASNVATLAGSQVPPPVTSTSLSSPTSPVRKKSRTTLGSPFKHVDTSSQARGKKRGRETLGAPRYDLRPHQAIRPSNLPTPDDLGLELNAWSETHSPIYEPTGKAELERVWKNIFICYPEMWDHYNRVAVTKDVL
ncbi:hypothetical protein C8Q78DRAFT_1015987 [Trametes maxima]|nr:hypothetical protein C8Q78DRAFT_1015987 [Trametes maxima]